MQINDSSFSGYISEKILEKHPIFHENSLMTKPKAFICERCHAIKSNKPNIPEVSDEKSLKSMDLTTFMSDIYGEIKPFSLIIYLIDLSNFLATSPLRSWLSGS